MQAYPNGAFLEVLPIEPGPFSFICEAYSENDTVLVVRDVFIPYKLKSSPNDMLEIDTTFVFPKSDWLLFSNDVFKVAFKGTPGCKASFTIDQLVWDMPMMELTPEKSFNWGDPNVEHITPSPNRNVEGIYIGTLYIQPWHKCYQKPVQFQLVSGNNDTMTYYAPGTLTVDNSPFPQIAEFKRDAVIAESGQKERRGVVVIPMRLEINCEAEPR